MFQDIVLGFTTGFTEITKEMADYFDALVPAFGGALHAILSDPIKSKYSQMAFVVQNEMSRAALSSPSGKYLDNPLNHEFNIDLKGDKKGYDMIIRFRTGFLLSSWLQSKGFGVYKSIICLSSA